MLFGSGFTGVLAFVGNGCVKLITSIGVAPDCAVGSPCNDFGGNWGYGYGCNERSGCREKKKERRRETNINGGWNSGWGWNNSWGGPFEEEIEEDCEDEFEDYRPNNWLGSVTEIPISKIASFSHNAL